MKYIGSLHSYFHHSLLLFEPKTLNEASVKVVHIESRGKHEKEDHPKRTKTTKRKEAKPSCTHCEKKWHDEEHCWKLHPELRPKRNDIKEKKKAVAIVQQDQESKSENDEKITGAIFVGVGSNDLGSYSGDEMKIATLGIVMQDHTAQQFHYILVNLGGLVFSRNLHS